MDKNFTDLPPANYYITDSQLFKLNKLASKLKKVDDLTRYAYLRAKDFTVVTVSNVRSGTFKYGNQIKLGIMKRICVMSLRSVLKSKSKALMLKKVIFIRLMRKMSNKI